MGQHVIYQRDLIYLYRKEGRPRTISKNRMQAQDLKKLSVSKLTANKAFGPYCRLFSLTYEIHALLQPKDQEYT